MCASLGATLIDAGATHNDLGWLGDLKTKLARRRREQHCARGGELLAAKMRVEAADGKTAKTRDDAWLMDDGRSGGSAKMHERTRA